MGAILLADSGATKAEWCVVDQKKPAPFFTPGINPYFMDAPAIEALLTTEVVPALKKRHITAVAFYGAGCGNANNALRVQKALSAVFPAAALTVETDLAGAAKALCGNGKGIACILGTGSNSGFYNGNKIARNSPGLGYVLGDEGSGAYLGKKVLQHYLYQTFDDELKVRFEDRYATTAAEILDAVYKQPFANRYLASFALFLAENRGHYMIENIVEDGLNDFFFQHLNKYPEVWKHPVHFTGSVAFGFKDVLQTLSAGYGFELGTVLKNPMQGLLKFHSV